MVVKIILFYKFASIGEAKNLREKHQTFCENLGVKGRVLIAKEGINGSVSGTHEQIEEYKSFLSNQEIFKDIEFKEEESINHPFEKMVTKVKKEIIRMDKKLDMSKKGKHISPKEFLELHNNNQVVVLDTRNDYEVQAGKFKRAINPNISSFKEFPSFVDNLNLSKETPIMMYCTGGIRCEKASAYMLEKGFTNVSQLHGGIINFCQKLPNTIWEGSCFVFDKRFTTNLNQKPNPINPCIHCQTKSDQYRNCKNKSCDSLIFICPKCQKEQHNCCSVECRRELLS